MISSDCRPDATVENLGSKEAASPQFPAWGWRGRASGPCRSCAVAFALGGLEDLGYLENANLISMKYLIWPLAWPVAVMQLFKRVTRWALQKRVDTHRESNLA